MEREQGEVNIHVTYCVPCGGKVAFDEMASIILDNIPSAKVTGEEDNRSGAFEVNINGKNVHSRLQTLIYPDVNRTLKVAKEISLGSPVPSSLTQKFIDCLVM